MSAPYKVLNDKNLEDSCYYDYKKIEYFCRTWKGSSLAGAEMILDAVAQFYDKYGNNSGFWHPEFHLYELTKNYPKPGHLIITNWMNEIFTDHDTVSPQEFIEAFLSQVWPILKAHSITRNPPGVSDELKSSVMECINKYGFADDFWELKSTSEIAAESQNANKASNSLKRKRDEDLLPSSEQGMLQVVKMLRRRPELCPNCFEMHTLQKCTNLKSDPRENLAAYIVPHFAEITKMKRYSHLVRYAEKLNRLLLGASVERVSISGETG